jgi:predicted small lipoprotein YifL
MTRLIILIISLSPLLYSCGKVGPLSLPEDKLNKSIITYPCDEDCMEKFEAEKKRQQSVTLQTD